MDYARSTYMYIDTGLLLMFSSFLNINAYAHNYLMIRLQLCNVNPIINPIMGV